MSWAKSITICSHSWNYAAVQSYQLSSLIVFPPKYRTRMIVVYAPTDERTANMVAFFERLSWPDTVEFTPMPMDAERVMRRPIGRHAAAIACDTDLMLFVDADYLYGEGCIDAICDNFPPLDPLCFGRTCRRTTMEGGDELVKQFDELGPRLYFPDDSVFVETRIERKAIGGSHWVRGDIARLQGYVPHRERLHTPQSRWGKTTEDVVYRKMTCCSRGVPIDVPNQFRIRHSSYGREHTGCKN